MTNRSAIKMTYAPSLDRAVLKGRPLIEQMADDMRVFGCNAGAVTEGDLELIGYTPHQIAVHARAAAREATGRSVR